MSASLWCMIQYITNSLHIQLLHCVKKPTQLRINLAIDWPVSLTPFFFQWRVYARRIHVTISMLSAMTLVEAHTASAMKDTSKGTQRTEPVGVGAVDLFGSILDKHVIVCFCHHWVYCTLNMFYMDFNHFSDIFLFSDCGDGFKLVNGTCIK